MKAERERGGPLDPRELVKPPPGMECTICLSRSGPPYPIQKGCACRDDVGLAHVGCLQEMAAKMESDKGWKVWYECGTCKQRYTGTVQMELARAWWAMVAGRPEVD